MTTPHRVGHAQVLTLAVPIMLSNVSEPLIGVVNTAVMGRLEEPHYIGAVAIGALIFSFLFWGFGFIRLSTGGLSAQAVGAKDTASLLLVLWRSLALALAIGLALIAISPWLGPLAIALVGGSDAVAREAQIYFNYRIWAAPAAFINFAVLGWLTGQGRTSLVFASQLVLNLSNVALSLLLVLGLGFKTQGVGLAVLISEYGAAFLGLVLVIVLARRLGGQPKAVDVLNWHAFKPLIAANRDIMIRTVCLVFAFAWFTSRGARAGDLTIAANAVLLNLFECSAYLIDGFAIASETLVGQAVGAKNRSQFRDAARITTIWALGFGALLSLLIVALGPQLVALMTTSPEVQSFALPFLPWLAVIPLISAFSFQMDGIFLGAMATRDMRNMMLLSLLIFLGSWWVLEPAYGNHGLWAALCIFFVARGVTFGTRLPALARSAFPHSA